MLSTLLGSMTAASYPQTSQQPRPESCEGWGGQRCRAFSNAQQGIECLEPLTIWNPSEVVWAEACRGGSHAHLGRPHFICSELTNRTVRHVVGLADPDQRLAR